MGIDRRGVAVAVALVVGVSAVSAGRQQPAGGSGAEPRGAISGSVRDASGRPLSGAVVALARIGAPAQGPPGSNTTGQVTDSAGRFVFTRLPVGDFTLAVSRSGYFNGGYGTTTESTTLRRITLRDGEWFQDATIKLWRQIAITGTVRDEVDEPVVGVWVRALARLMIAGAPQWVAGPVTKTDDRGIYRFAGLTPGKWIVMVPSVQSAVPAETSLYALAGITPESAAQSEAAGFPVVLPNVPALAPDPAYRVVLGTSPTPPPAAVGRPQVYPIAFHPSARSLADAAVIDTASGDDRFGVDVVLRPMPAFKVAGSVDGSAGALAGLVLRLMPAGFEDLGAGNEAATALVSPNGSFAMFNVASGAYTILATRTIASYTYNPGSLTMGRMPTAPGAMMNNMSVSAVTSGPPSTMFETRGQIGDAAFIGRVRIEVGDRDLTSVLLPMRRGVSIRGRVVVEAGPTGAPGGPPFRTIVADPAGGEPSLGRPSAQLNGADASGTFAIEGLMEGEYLLRVAGAGLTKSITHDGKDYTYRPFDTSAGQDFADVVITMTRSPAALAGFARDAQGRIPSTGTTVICVPAEREQWSRYGIQPQKLNTASVGSNGSYRFSALPAGDYLVFAVDDASADLWKDPARLAPLAPSAAKVTLGWGESKTQDVPVLRER